VPPIDVVFTSKESESNPLFRLMIALHNHRYGIITGMLAPSVDQFEMLSGQMLGAIQNASTRGMYRKAIADFLAWWRLESSEVLDARLLRAHIAYLLKLNYSSATVNQRLAAIRKLIGLAAEKSVLDLADASEAIRVAGVREGKNPNRASLNTHETEALINAPEPSTKKGLRDRALLGLLVGCGLTRSEVVRLSVGDIQRRDRRWVLHGVTGRRGRVRTIALPEWAKIALDTWLQSVGLKTGPVFRALDRRGWPAQHAISSQAVLPIVVAYGRSIGLDVKPGDLRRTCAQLCRANGGDLEQIQLLLGHASIQTTERYLGHTPKPASAANDRLRLKWRVNKMLAS